MTRRHNPRQSAKRLFSGRLAVEAGRKSSSARPDTGRSGIDASRGQEVRTIVIRRIVGTFHDFEKMTRITAMGRTGRLAVLRTECASLRPDGPFTDTASTR